MFSPKILGLKVETFGIEWTVQNCTNGKKFLGSGLASHDLTHWVVTQLGGQAGRKHSTLHGLPHVRHTQSSTR